MRWIESLLVNLNHESWLSKYIESAQLYSAMYISVTLLLLPSENWSSRQLNTGTIYAWIHLAWATASSLMQCIHFFFCIMCHSGWRKSWCTTLVIKIDHEVTKQREHKCSLDVSFPVKWENKMKKTSRDCHVTKKTFLNYCSAKSDPNSPSEPKVNRTFDSCH